MSILKDFHFVQLHQWDIVYPAAGLAAAARSARAQTILVNFEMPINSYDFDEVHLGMAGEILPGLVETWLAE